MRLASIARRSRPDEDDRIAQTCATEALQKVRPAVRGRRVSLRSFRRLECWDAVGQDWFLQPLLDSRYQVILNVFEAAALDNHSLRRAAMLQLLDSDVAELDAGAVAEEPDMPFRVGDAA